MCVYTYVISIIYTYTKIYNNQLLPAFAHLSPTSLFKSSRPFTAPTCTSGQPHKEPNQKQRHGENDEVRLGGANLATNQKKTSQKVACNLIAWRKKPLKPFSLLQLLVSSNINCVSHKSNINLKKNRLSLSRQFGLNNNPRN